MTLGDREFAEEPSMLTALGLRVVSVTAERAVLELPYSDAATQPLGLFHAGAILALADTAATHLLRFVLATRTGAREGLDPESFPLGIQVSGNILRARRNTALCAEATPLHIGRSTAVVDTKVRDEAGALVAAVTTTHFLPSGRPAEG